MSARTNLKTWLAMGVFLLGMVCTTAGQVITVDDDGPADYNNIQPAIDSASDGDVIIVQPGLYGEDINFLGKNITLTGTNPANLNIVKETVMGFDDGNEVIVMFRGTEDSNCVLTGFNINGHISGFDWRVDPSGENHTHATVSFCLLQGNYGSSAIVGCDGMINNCVVADNLNQGRITQVMYPAISQCYGLIENCTIANNNCASAIELYEGGETTIENCIIYGNTGYQIFADCPATVSIQYSVVEGGLDGIWLFGVDCNLNWGLGNVDTDPCFAKEGYWDFNEPWVFFEGDYHLLPGSPCIDAGDNNSVPEDITDLDGDGNTTEPIPFDLDGELRFVDDPCTPDTGNGVPPIVDMGAFEFQLPDPVDLLFGLMEKVVDLNLPHGIANSLSAKLDAAMKLLEDANGNNDVAALNLLQAFINAVEAQRGKKIPEADADDLIVAAQGIIAVLSGT